MCFKAQHCDTIDMNKIADEIRKITSVFLDDHADSRSIVNSAGIYRKLLLNLSELSERDTQNEVQIYSSNGKAVSINTAIDCITDGNRTYKFIYGIFRAIKSRLNDGQNELDILYAGSGPFAALLLPIMLRFEEENIRYSLMDINPATLDILKRILEKLELNTDKVKILCADATQYQLDSFESYDIIISETMQAALAREQQVSVFLNLIRQTTEETIFIPENIEISLGYRSIGMPRYELTLENCKSLATIFEVNRSALSTQLNQVDNTTAFPIEQIQINSEKLSQADLMLLMTRIKIYDDVVLDHFESGLTLPLIMDNISDKKSSQLLAEIQYKIDQEPRFDFKIGIKQVGESR